MNILSIGGQVNLEAHSNELEPIVVFNNSNTNATGVIVTVVMPAGVSYVSDTPSVGTFDDLTGEWDIGPLLANTTETLNLTVEVTDDTLAPFVFTYTVTHDNSPDDIPGDDASTRTIEGLQCSQFQDCFNSLLSNLTEYDSMADAIVGEGNGKPFLASLTNIEGWSYRAILVTPLA